MDNEVLATVKQGILRGKCQETEKGHKYFAFLGVPFAKPPVGPLRFKAPQPAECWEGIRNAQENGEPCIQKNLMSPNQEIIGGEDCLHVNVFTSHIPKTNEKSALKPVMVWIHGGGFVTGSNTTDMYHPDFLINKDIVLVSTNYRLGVLGFLSLKDPKLGVSGNAGLKDQCMALKWVQENITSFGGDPNNVTLFGESAGSASVGFHIVSPMSTGLFHKAIMQSGDAGSSWALGTTSVADEILEIMGKTTENEAEALHVLQSTSTRELFDAQLKMPDEWKPSKARNLNPVVETSTSEERFLTDFPMKLMNLGKFNKVPMIIGCTSNEGMLINFIETTTKVDMTPTSEVEFVPHNFLSHPNQEALGKKIQEFYFGKDTPSRQNRQYFFDYVSDIFFVRPMLKSIETIMESSKEDIYLYKFSVESELSVFKNTFKMDDGAGVCHGEDLFYVFKSSMAPPIKPGSIEELTVERMTTWWTNFAKFSNPNGRKCVVPNTPMWPPTSFKLEYLNIDKKPTVETEMAKKMNAFWKSIEAEIK